MPRNAPAAKRQSKTERIIVPDQSSDISLAALTEHNDISVLEQVCKDNTESQAALKELLVAIDRIEPFQKSTNVESEIQQYWNSASFFCNCLRKCAEPSRTERIFGEFGMP